MSINTNTFTQAERAGVSSHANIWLQTLYKVNIRCKKCYGAGRKILDSDWLEGEHITLSDNRFGGKRLNLEPSSSLIRSNQVSGKALIIPGTFKNLISHVEHLHHVHVCI